MKKRSTVGRPSYWHPQGVVEWVPQRLDEEAVGALVSRDLSSEAMMELSMIAGRYVAASKVSERGLTVADAARQIRQTSRAASALKEALCQGEASEAVALELDLLHAFVVEQPEAAALECEPRSRVEIVTTLDTLQTYLRFLEESHASSGSQRAFGFRIRASWNDLVRHLFEWCTKYDIPTVYHSRAGTREPPVFRKLLLMLDDLRPEQEHNKWDVEAEIKAIERALRPTP